MAVPASMSLDLTLPVPLLPPLRNTGSPPETYDTEPTAVASSTLSASTTDYHFTQPGETSQGYSLNVLSQNQKKKVLCVLCNLVLRDPIQSLCGHRYCRECYMRFVASTTGALCPACVSEGDTNAEVLAIDGIQPDFAIKKDMSKLEAKCVNLGCHWTGIFGDFIQHETKCDFQKRKCVCGQMIFPSNMDSHQKTECPLRSIQCTFCEIKLLARDAENHEGSCEFYPQVCKGCHCKMARNKMAAHLDPIRGDCENRKCPFGCDTTCTQGHLQEMVIAHLNTICGEVKTLGAQLESVHITSQGAAANEIFQKVADLESKIVEIRDQLQSLASETSTEGTAQLGADNRGTVASLSEKQATIESIMAVLNKELEKIILDHQRFEQQIRVQSDLMGSAHGQLMNLERKLALKDIALADQDLRIQALENTSFDGVLLWKITDFNKKRQEAISGRCLSIYSTPFFSCRSGYKMCCRLYPNGDGMGKGSHMSLFFVVMKGAFDAILTWPFKQKVTMLLLDQGNRDNLVDAFRPDPSSSSFRRPVNDMNIASGCPLFCPLGKLEGRKPLYVKDDTIFIKVIVDTSGV